jgi:glutathionylspermidine synthase
MMERLRIEPRRDFAAKLEAQGLSFHDRDHYWRDDACYRFTLAQAEQIEAATKALHVMCKTALKAVSVKRRLGQLGIPEPFWGPIDASIERGDFSLYGRLDLAYDGKSPPKLLEYNADTPTSLLESAVCQWFWLKDCYPSFDQFNSLHERLVERWRALPGAGAVHIACIADSEEDWACTAYLMDTVVQAGREAVHVCIEDVGWDADCRTFVDNGGRPIENLFKLYPWEWLMREEFGPRVLEANTRFIEPLWKSVLSCKGLLPVLWELFPYHPNLLPTYFEPDRLESYAKKPLYSREGANVELFAGGACIACCDGPYGDAGSIYQALYPLPTFDGMHPIIGSWLVDGQPAGMCVREDVNLITTNTSNFVPHYLIE